MTLRSQRGASYEVLSRVGGAEFELSVSVPLVLEYEAAANAQARELGLTHADIDDVVDYLCSVAHPRQIFYLWRPVLRDPKDDMVLELAVEAGCDAIITHKLRDFVGAERFGITVLTPSAFLQQLERRVCRYRSAPGRAEATSAPVPRGARRRAARGGSGR